MKQWQPRLGIDLGSCRQGQDGHPAEWRRSLMRALPASNWPAPAPPMAPSAQTHLPRFHLQWIRPHSARLSPCCSPKRAAGARSSAGLVFDKLYRNPRTYSWSVNFEQALTPTLKFFPAFNYAKGVHITRFVNRNDAVFGSPWSTGLGADRKNGIGRFDRSRMSAKSLFRGWTTGMIKQLCHKLPVPMELPACPTDYSDDDQERDPFNYYYRVANNFKPEYNYSGRDERHRFNAFGCISRPGASSSRHASARIRPSQLQSMVSNHSVLMQANGTIIKRNTVRKDNEFTRSTSAWPRVGSMTERFR